METRNGVADEELAKKEAERSRKRKLDPDDDPIYSQKRSRSMSSFSSISVSTISTASSRSSSPKHQRNYLDEVLDGRRKTPRPFPNDRREAKEHTSPNRSSISYTSDTSSSDMHEDRPKASNTRHRHISSGRHGRGGESMTYETSDLQLKNNYHKRKRSLSLPSSYTSESSNPRRTQHSPLDDDRRIRRKRSSVSPDARGRNRGLHDGTSIRRARSRSRSLDRSRIARNRRSMTPKQVKSPHRESVNQRRGRFRDQNYEDRRAPRRTEMPQNRVKARSISPFSKRLALTQAMNAGR